VKAKTATRLSASMQGEIEKKKFFILPQKGKRKKKKKGHPPSGGKNRTQPTSSVEIKRRGDRKKEKKRDIISTQSVIRERKRGAGLPAVGWLGRMWVCNLSAANRVAGLRNGRRRRRFPFLKKGKEER